MRASIEGQHELAARVQTALSLPTKKHAENVIDAVLGSLKTTLLNHKEKNYAGRQEDRLKTANADRTVELHSSVAQLLRDHIGTRAGLGVREQEDEGSVRFQLAQSGCCIRCSWWRGDAWSDRHESRRARFSSFPRRSSPCEQGVQQVCSSTGLVIAALRI